MVQTPQGGSGNRGVQNQVDLRAELDRLEEAVTDLKMQYEQYFTGLVPLPPDKLHAEVKRRLRALLSAPFRGSEVNYRLRALKQRYQTFDSYFQRVLKQREDGVYHRDVFKANLREQIASEEQYGQTAEGAAAKGIKELFESYRRALETHAGKGSDLDFNAFKESLTRRAKELREKHGVKKLTFKVVVKDGRVTVQAKALDRKKDESAGRT